MTVTPELMEKIQRYYHVERWRTGTIARQLKVHYGTVQRVLRQAGLPGIGKPVLTVSLCSILLALPTSANCPKKRALRRSHRTWRELRRL